MEVMPKTPGKVRCLGGCDKMFKSKDKFTNRICPSCTKRNNKERIPRIVASLIEIDGKAIVISDSDS